MHRSKNKWLCVDCSRNTQHEHYFVRNEIWFDLAAMPENGMLCIVCLETRIGRELRPEDFTNCFLNDPKKNTMTALLRRRLTTSTKSDKV